MKKLSVLFMLIVSIATHAQDQALLQADKDFAAKSYDNALTTYLANKNKLSAVQEFNVGDIYYQKQDYKEAIKWFKESADKDHPAAFVRLGTIYFQGKGVSADQKEAYKWVKKAAELGDRDGMTNLGILYLQGTGVKMNYTEAISWLTKAADKGSATAMFRLSNLYFLGNGVAQDEKKGIELLDAAAEKGHSTAMYTKGMLQLKGRTYKKDPAEAMIWLKKAGEKGSTDASYEVGKLYLKGLGTPLNINDALVWFKKAAEQKNEAASKYVDIIEKAMATYGPEMVKVEGGTFTMGEDVPDYEMSYEPAHKVTLSTYSIGKYEVTVAEYRAFCVFTGRDIPSAPRSYGSTQKEWTDRHPAGEISWNDAVEYCKWLSKRTGKTYRLPTEAEWEYAARGGNKSRGFKYSGSNVLDEVAWNENTSKYSSQVVGSKKPNELGIYDMSGNLQEWCSDFYEDGYPSGPVTNPRGPASGERKVIRGGNYLDRPGVTFGFEPNFRSSSAKLDEQYNERGFRVVLEGAGN